MGCGGADRGERAAGRECDGSGGQERKLIRVMVFSGKERIMGSNMVGRHRSHPWHAGDQIPPVAGRSRYNAAIKFTSWRVEGPEYLTLVSRWYFAAVPDTPSSYVVPEN